MWRADASITAGVYNTTRKLTVRATSAELWETGNEQCVLLTCGQKSVAVAGRDERPGFDRL